MRTVRTALDKATQAGAWVVLDRTSVALGPGASTTVGFRVTVPAGAASGVHLAGISALVPSVADDAGAPLAGATVQSRRVIAVQVDPPGAAQPGLVITGVAPVARPDGLYAEMAVANRRRLDQGRGEHHRARRQHRPPVQHRHLPPGHVDRLSSEMDRQRRRRRPPRSCGDPLRRPRGGVGRGASA